MFFILSYLVIDETGNCLICEMFWMSAYGLSLRCGLSCIRLVSKYRNKVNCCLLISPDCLLCLLRFKLSVLDCFRVTVCKGIMVVEWFLHPVCYWPISSPFFVALWITSFKWAENIFFLMIWSDVIFPLESITNFKMLYIIIHNSFSSVRCFAKSFNV